MATAVYKSQCMYCFCQSPLSLCLNCKESYCEEHLNIHTAKYPKCELYLYFEKGGESGSGSGEGSRKRKSITEDSGITGMDIGSGGDNSGSGGDNSGSDNINNNNNNNNINNNTKNNINNNNINNNNTTTTTTSLPLGSSSSSSSSTSSPYIYSYISNTITHNPSLISSLLAASNPIQFSSDYTLPECNHKIKPKNKYKNILKCNDCTLTSNLWLCLECCSVGCGRTQFDGSGGNSLLSLLTNLGNSHALAHYQSTKHTLSVKLGTITSTDADVYCYECDDLVRCAELSGYLEMVGIEREGMVKTDQSIRDMEESIQFKIEDSVEMLRGRGRRGFKNIGNSCYMNSVMQVVVRVIGALSKGALSNGSEIVCSDANDTKHDTSHHNTTIPHNSTTTTSLSLSSNGSISTHSFLQCNLRPQDCINCQLLKLLIEVNSDHDRPIDLTLLKRLLSLNTDFYNNLQQDVYEYYQMIISKLGLEHLFTVGLLSKIRSSAQVEESISIRLGISDTISSALRVWANEEVVEISSSESISKLNRIKYYPKYLVFVINRFIYRDGVIEKDTSGIRVDEEIDMGEYYSDENATTDDDCIKEEFLSLVQMGFREEDVRMVCRGGKVKTVEEAMERLLSGDIPTASGGGGGGAAAASVNESDVGSIVEMGFSRDMAIRALELGGGSVEVAIEKLFSGEVVEGSQIDPPPPPVTVIPIERDTSRSKYRIHSVIAHKGKNSHAGHYVVFIRDGGKWILFNDENVYESEDGIEMGYVYVYERI